MPDPVAGPSEVSAANHPEKVKPHDAADRLGTESVGRLLMRFSLPAITGMVVNALYNLVDRIYVGRGISEIALAGLSLVMPLMTITFSFAMLFGAGAAYLISIRLGQGRRQEAENTINHCVFLLIGMGLLIGGLGITFLDNFLSILGAQQGSEALSYARDYYRVTLYGSVFLQLGFGLSHCTRAQGFPVMSMIGMLLGAIMNIILDPLFIFVFRLGVKGVAWATVISQFCSCIFILRFSLSKKAIIRLRFSAFKPSIKVVYEIIRFGFAGFIMNLLMSGVQLIYNTSMGWYGAASLGAANGGDIALSGMNIINTISMMIMMPVFGTVQGVQPILGYNYGAKKYGRVLKTYFLGVSFTSCICITGFILVQVFNIALIRAFVPDGSPQLYTFAPWAMRVVMLLLPFMGFQAISANFFIVTGRPRVSLILNLLRQCIILIPCILLFGRLWGLHGVVAAAPVADGFSLMLTGSLIFRELKKLRAQVAETG